MLKQDDSHTHALKTHILISTLNYFLFKITHGATKEKSGNVQASRCQTEQASIHNTKGASALDIPEWLCVVFCHNVAPGAES